MQTSKAKLKLLNILNCSSSFSSSDNRSMSSSSLASFTSGQSSSDGSVSGNVAASQVLCTMSIKSDEFEEMLKSDEIHCMRDNNNGCT